MLKSLFFSHTKSGNEVGFLPRTPELRKKTAGRPAGLFNYLSPEWLHHFLSHAIGQTATWPTWPEAAETYSLQEAQEGKQSTVWEALKMICAKA